MKNYFWISLFFLVISFTNPLLADSDEHNDHENEKEHMHEDKHDDHEDEDMFEEHSSHVHGHANAQISYARNVLNIKKTLSSIDVFGFEYAPKNDEQKNIISENVKLMEKAENLFSFKNNACELESAHVESELIESDSGSDDHEDHHEHEHEDEHHHDAHDDEAEEESHSDVVANYIFKCDNKKLESIEYLIFDYFPSLEEIEVEYISEDHPALFNAPPSNRIQKLN